MKAGYWIVKINIGRHSKKQESRFVRVDRHAPNLHLIKARHSATQFESEGLAQIISDDFWDRYWDKYKEKFDLWSREVVYVKAKRLPSPTQTSTLKGKKK